MRYKLHDQSFMPDASPRDDWYRSDLWTKDGPDTPVTFYTDWSLGQAQGLPPSGVRRVAVLLEPPAIIRDFYQDVAARRSSFSKVCTHQRDLVATDPSYYAWYPYGTTWIHHLEDRKVHEKSRGVSLISSAKASTDGHRLRHEAVKALGDAVDVYGRSYRPIARKVEALGPYRFSVVIENCRTRGFFTEKLVDCLMTGTVPIYWGCQDVGDYVHPSGVLVAESLEQVVAHARRAASSEGRELYASMLPSVERNFSIAQAYLAPEKWIVEKLLPTWSWT